MKYEAPEAEIMRFGSADIVTASGDTPVDDIRDPYVGDNFNCVKAITSKQKERRNPLFLFNCFVYHGCRETTLYQLRF